MMKADSTAVIIKTFYIYFLSKHMHYILGERIRLTYLQVLSLERLVCLWRNSILGQRQETYQFQCLQHVILYDE